MLRSEKPGFAGKRLAGAEGEPVDFWEVGYPSGALTVKGMLALPREAAPPWPGLIYCRGGIGLVGMVTPERLAPFARRGCAVFAPYYRGRASGQGRDEFGGADREDVYRALEWMAESRDVCGTRIPLVGFSRGSIMAARAGAEHPNAGPVVLWGGVGDLLLTYEERVDLRRMLRRVVGHPVKQREAYEERSPYLLAGRMQEPVLVVQGTEDVQVSAEHAIRMLRALREADKPHDAIWLEGFGHHLPRKENEETIGRLLGWLAAVSPV